MSDLELIYGSIKETFTDSMTVPCTLVIGVSSYPISALPTGESWAEASDDKNTRIERVKYFRFIQPANTIIDRGHKIIEGANTWTIVTQVSSFDDCIKVMCSKDRVKSIGSIPRIGRQ